jgi:hypothetical protein
MREMKITNRYRPDFSMDKVYWRVFQPFDDAHLLGTTDGFLDRDESATYEGPPDFFQLEFKNGGPLGPSVIQAGEVLIR